MTPPIPKTGRPVTDLVIEAMTAAHWYGRATERAKQVWPPWTIRRRRAAAAVWEHHALAALGRLQHAVGEAGEAVAADQAPGRVPQQKAADPGE